MVTYEKLSRRPPAAPSLIGMTLEAFDKLFSEFAVAHAQRLAVRPDGLIEAVSERVPGGQTHDLTLLRQMYRHRRSEHSRGVRIGAGLVDRRIAARPLKVYAGAGA